MWRRLTWLIYFLFMPQRRSVKKSLFVGWVCFFVFFLSTALMIKLASSSLGLFIQKIKKQQVTSFWWGEKYLFFLFLFFLSTAAAKLFLKMISKIGDETNKKFLILSVGNFFVLFFFFLPRCKFFQWKGWLTFLLSFFLSHKKTILAQPQKIGRDKRNDF